MSTAIVEHKAPTAAGSGDFHEKAVMSKNISTLFLVGRSNVGKAGVDLASIRTHSRERFTIGSDVLAGGV